MTGTLPDTPITKAGPGSNFYKPTTDRITMNAIGTVKKHSLELSKEIKICQNIPDFAG
jgi:hypothetical protein